MKVCRIQEIDLFFTERGFSRSYIYKTIIYPNFFISKRTYYEYLTINAKQKLTDTGINWRVELSRIVPVNYTQLMKDMRANPIFKVEEINSNDYSDMVKEGCKH